MTAAAPESVTPNAGDLLAKLQPVVRFDSHEAFFAHDVRAMADNHNFRLVRAALSADYVIASHDGDGSLSLDFLALTAGRYPNGKEYAEGDHFGLELRGPDAFADKVGDYREIERQLDPAVRNRAFGRAVAVEKDLWLQYWYFYIYNDAQFGGRVDLHEGDWEMIQLLVQEGQPTKALYAQHAYAELRDWEHVEQDPALGCPIIYSGRGSHASYFERGLHRTHVNVAGTFVPLWWDAADGAGPEIRQPLVALDPTPAWAQWRGAWGGTQPRLPLIDGESPGGPITHGQWGNPASLLNKAISHETRPLATAQRVNVRRASPGLRLRFDFSVLEDPPERLVITCNTGAEPPITDTVVVDTAERGKIFTRRALDPDRSYTVDVSTISAQGIATSPPAEYTTQLRPLRAVSPAVWVAALLAPIDRFTLWLGERLARRVRREPRRGP